MKKLMTIAAAAFFLFTGCSKEELAPPTAPGDQPVVQKSAQLYQYFMITNNETDFGVVEYRINYTDCSDTPQSVPLLMGDKIVICVKGGMIKTNFAHSIVLIEN